MSLAAGVSLFSLSLRMGTSLDMIDRTYGHLAPDAEVAELALVTPTTSVGVLAQQFAKCRKPGREPTPLSRHAFLGGRKAQAPMKSWDYRMGWSYHG